MANPVTTDGFLLARRQCLLSPFRWTHPLPPVLSFLLTFQKWHYKVESLTASHDVSSQERVNHLLAFVN